MWREKGLRLDCRGSCRTQRHAQDQPASHHGTRKRDFASLTSQWARQYAWNLWTDTNECFSEGLSVVGHDVTRDSTPYSSTTSIILPYRMSSFCPLPVPVPCIAPSQYVAVTLSDQGHRINYSPFAVNDSRLDSQLGDSVAHEIGQECARGPLPEDRR